MEGPEPAITASDNDSGCAVEEHSWVPPGLTRAQVQQYMAALPDECVPYVNSIGDQLRSRRLLRQLPPHDHEGRYCGSLCAAELQELQLFSARRKRDTLGRGHVRPLPAALQHGHCAQCGGGWEAESLAVFVVPSHSHAAWHPACFVCAVCRELLVDLVYFHLNGKLYCGRHHAEQLKPRCAACDELIFAAECTQAEGMSWHVKHFCCAHCDSSLATRRYEMHGAAPYCYDCYTDMFSDSCDRCGDVIEVGASQMSDGRRQWHDSPRCFCCYSCGEALRDDPSVVCRESGVYCSAQCATAAPLSIIHEQSTETQSLTEAASPTEESHGLEPQNGPEVTFCEASGNAAQPEPWLELETEKRVAQRREPRLDPNHGPLQAHETQSSEDSQPCLSSHSAQSSGAQQGSAQQSCQSQSSTAERSLSVSALSPERSLSVSALSPESDEAMAEHSNDAQAHPFTAFVDAAADVVHRSRNAAVAVAVAADKSTTECSTPMPPAMRPLIEPSDYMLQRQQQAPGDWQVYIDGNIDGNIMAKADLVGVSEGGRSVLTPAAPQLQKLWNKYRRQSATTGHPTRPASRRSERDVGQRTSSAEASRLAGYLSDTTGAHRKASRRVSGSVSDPEGPAHRKASRLATEHEQEQFGRSEDTRSAVRARVYTLDGARAMRYNHSSGYVSDSVGHRASREQRSARGSGYTSDVAPTSRRVRRNNKNQYCVHVDSFPISRPIVTPCSQSSSLVKPDRWDDQHDFERCSTCSSSSDSDFDYYLDKPRVAYVSQDVGLAPVKSRAQIGASMPKGSAMKVGAKMKKKKKGKNCIVS